MIIHPVKNDKGATNRYCGPAALSIVTGMTTGEAARLLRHVTGKPSIKGTNNRSMRDAFARCGILMKSIYKGPAVSTIKVPTLAAGQRVAAVRTKDLGKRIDKRLTLAAWFRATSELRSAGRVFLVSAGRHWQIVSGRRFVCGQTKAIVGFDHDKVHRRARVDEVFELTSTSIVIPPETKKGERPPVGPRARFNALCKNHGLTFTSDGLTINPEYIDIAKTEAWPLGLSFCFWDWDDAIRIVNEALTDPGTISEEGWVSH